MKDSYWFRHDSTAGRGLKIRKIQHIYGHVGKGLYWDVVEVLREQTNYRYLKDDSSLQMLASLVGCKDDILFLSWFRDCIGVGLFEICNDKFFCPPLCKNMIMWEKQKRNGSQTKAKRKPNDKPNRSIIEHNSIEQDSIEQDSIINTNEFEDLKNFFGYTELRNPDKTKRIWQFLKLLAHENKTTHFIHQFKFYKLYKNASKEKIHSFSVFLDGGWDAENWEHKYKALNGQPVRIERPDRKSDFYGYEHYAEYCTNKKQTPMPRSDYDKWK